MFSVQPQKAAPSHRSKALTSRTRETWKQTKTKPVMSYSTNEYALFPMTRFPLACIIFSVTVTYHLRHCLILPYPISQCYLAGSPTFTGNIGFRHDVYYVSFRTGQRPAPFRFLSFFLPSSFDQPPVSRRRFIDYFHHFFFCAVDMDMD